jgi:predicted aspartyl protease
MGMITRRCFCRTASLALPLLSTSLSAWRPAFGAASQPLRTTRGGRLLLDVRVNGQPVEALLDSGAEMSVLDLSFARRLELEGTRTETARGSGAGVLEAGIVDGVRLDAVGLELKNQTVAVLDLSDVADRLLGRPLEMILGREIFDAARLQIDIAGGRIEVMDDTVDPPGVRLPLTTEHGIETFPVRVEDQAPVQAALDLGNGSNVILGADYAKRAGLLADGRAVTRETGGGIGGATERDVITLSSLEIAGRVFRDVPASVDEGANANDVNVGLSVLRHFLITTDYSERLLWLLPRD